MNQTTAEASLRELEPLIGEWTLLATWPNGDRYDGKASFEWLEAGRLVLHRSTIDHPQAPDTVSVIGCDAANGTYYQLYTDERNVCRVIQMSIGKGEWKLWREGDPFPQRFTGRFSDDGNTITMRLEKADDGVNFEHDFDIVYRRVSGSKS